MAEKLFAHGIKSIGMLAATEAEMIAEIPGVGEKSGNEWIEEAIRLLDEETSGNKE